jgi:hypothetical protein
MHLSLLFKQQNKLFKNLFTKVPQHFFFHYFQSFKGMMIYCLVLATVHV